MVERWLLRLKTLTDWSVAQIVTLLLYLAKKLPAERSTHIAERLGRKLAPILPRYKLAKQNIKLAFPEKSDEEVSEIARGTWGHVARSMAEYVFLDELFDFDPDNPDAGTVEIAGIDNFVKLRDRTGPVIIFTAHTGNFEILPIAASTHELNVTALFRPPNNRFLAERLLKARLTAKGHLVPSRAGAAWVLAGILDNGGAVGVLVDQAFARGPTIEFLGREATANPLTAKLARQYNCDIHPARCVRLPGGRFRLELQDALELPRNESGAIDVLETTRLINSVVEDWVREYPEQWLWLHNRWKQPRPRKRRHRSV